MRITYRLYPKVIMVAVVSVMAVAMVATNIFAQAKSEAPNALRITPVRTDIAVDPGASKTVKVTITNPSNAQVTVRAIQNDFVAGDERGTPALVLDETEYAEKHSLKRFMKPLENVTIPANASVIVETVIEVPADAEPGGYFGALRFAPVSPDSGGQVNLSASAASIILLKVNGEVTEGLTLTDFAVQRNGKPGALFSDGSNMTAFVRFKNDGSVQLAPIGKVSVTKGNTIVSESDFNNQAPQDMILPDSARRWDVPLKNINGFGYYTVTATFTYGSNNQSVEVIKSFWVIPVWLAITAAVVALVIVALVIFLVARFRNGRQQGRNRPSNSKGGLRNRR